MGVLTNSAGLGNSQGSLDWDTSFLFVCIPGDAQARVTLNLIVFDGSVPHSPWGNGKVEYKPGWGQRREPL